MSVSDLLKSLSKEFAVQRIPPLVPGTLEKSDLNPLEQIYGRICHGALAFWNKRLPDERALAFFATDDKIPAHQRIRADLIHQLFPRANLLTERHRSADAKSLRPDFSTLTVLICPKEKSIRWVEKKTSAKLLIPEASWDMLLPADFVRKFDDAADKLHTIIEHVGAQSWHHVVDAGRTLRGEFAHWLDYRRKLVAQQFVGNLCKAVRGMTPALQICQRRLRTYPGLEKKEPVTFSDNVKILPFVDAETIDDFLSLLQGLRCYMGASGRQLISSLRRRTEGRAAGLLIVTDALTETTEANVAGMSDALDDAYDTFVGNLRDPEDSPGVLHEDTVPTDVSEWINGNVTTSKSLAFQVAELAKELAENHAIHEGRQLRYRFVVAGSAQLWPEIEEVLSFEAFRKKTPTPTNDTTKPHANLLEAHWSIFQPERVFGVIDTLSNNDAQAPHIQRVVRIRPPVVWSGLESEAMDSLAKAAHPCFVAVVLGRGRVRLSFSDDGEQVETGVWDVMRGTLNKGSPIRDCVAQIVEVAGVGDDPRISEALTTTLSEISEASGEGALLVTVGEGNVHDVVQRTCMEMDASEDRMAWRDHKHLRWVDRALLRAMLILDGATVIQRDEHRSTTRNTKENDDEPIIRPRLIVYPFVACRVHGHAKAYSVVSWENPRERPDDCSCPRDPENRDIIREQLMGKGSRKHGAANIAVLLQQQDVNKTSSFVLSVSADGPVQPWPPKNDNRSR